MLAPQMQGQPETPENIPSNHAPVGFYASRIALNLQGEHKVIPADQTQAFNPHKETTIPRSHGIDHSKSSPVVRKQIQPSGGAMSPYPRRNFENPSLNLNRQIGAPPQPPRGAGNFRQPTAITGGVKRPADGQGPGNPKYVALQP